MNLSVGAYNIFSDAWLRDFFPDDLPQDWRIDYYANEFNLLHLPSKVWTDNQFSPFDEPWPENLAVILQVTEALIDTPRWPEIENWAEHCDSLIATLPPDTRCSETIRQTSVEVKNDIMTVAEFVDVNLLILQPENLDLKTLRSEIEELAGHSDDALLILDVSPAELNKARTLIELMGL